MPLRRDLRSRLPVSVSVLLALVLALLSAFCPPSYGEPAGPLPLAASQSPASGCGGAEEDRGAHPSPPPRGALSYELPPVPYDTHGGLDPLCGATVPGVVPDRGPPPLDPPTPVDLSILRV
ncbi:hypothetical protein [Streptomyces jumonjinensis]|uniref:hypothetical protein n=1 Tax=Streptomyces jumonjinensis TaxID=1945 RepID=UPI0037A436A0